MKPSFRIVLFAAIVALFPAALSARLLIADPGNYLSFLSGLEPGDTLSLLPGRYTQNLTLRDVNGTEAAPIVITGSPLLYTTVFVAQSCCNTVSITRCSYLVIRNLQLDGGNVPVDAVKGEGTAGNWAHHITLEYLDIVGYGADQQIVGISTKCHAWNWVIRKNRIVGAGTGLYLGNSDGSRPFVNGLIEYNLVENTIGYNMEIKHQRDGERDTFPGTAVDGKTIVRYNVFCKERNASTGGSARPNVLFGAFPSSGWGANDVYEVYGNFFYQNPVEALLQVTGNIALYDNIFVNHFDPSGFRAVYVTAQNGVSPRDVWIFHNTVWAANSSGGIRLYNADPAHRQYCHGNAVFSASAITNFSDTLGNVTDSYANASLHLLAPTADLTALDLYPRADRCTGAPILNDLFSSFTDARLDFNRTARDWSYRGAYSGCCRNPGWKLQLDTMAHSGQTGTVVRENVLPGAVADLYPNPAMGSLTVTVGTSAASRSLRVCDMLGHTLLHRTLAPGFTGSSLLDVSTWTPGVYFLVIEADEQLSVHRFLLEAM